MTDWGVLDHIDPGLLAYQDWLAVGMAIKHEGGMCHVWDEWSKRDTARYKGDCARKWDGFNGSGTPVTWGTVYELAKQHGWQPPQKREQKAFEWDDTIGGGGDEDLRVIDPAWVEDAEVHSPTDWNPVAELTAYLNALFEAQEYVGYVTESWLSEDERYLPKKGSYTRTAGELIHELAKCNGDIGAVVGDYNPVAGAWIRFNPLDGKGVRDDNVTAFRYALIESDTLAIERQAAIYAELELPIAALVHSGKKSLHAIVRVNATSKEEYRERVNFLHQVCKKNGLEIDGANKNPSRLSRMPGVKRNGQKQFLAGVNQGKASWEDWKHHIEEANDNLPDIECLADVFEFLPPLAPPLIDGLLREGHKMLLAGPSKAGKSFLLLQLTMSIAEGREWLGWQCAQGKVLYVNLELDRASCLHRLKTLYGAHGWTPANINNIDIWNLRGKAVPMDLLAPKLIRRALKKRYKAVIIDPIYKVITGDENAADKMAHFCNQFDRVCTELGSAVVYCHHHSKGSQGQKNSRDRSSGSGVFSRDPDAILDLIELIVTADRAKQIVNREVCAAVTTYLEQRYPAWRETISQDTALVSADFVTAAFNLGVPADCREEFDRPIREAGMRANQISGWRIEGTLREFPSFPAKVFFFRYPIHIPDTDDLLADAKTDGEEAPWVAQQRDRAAMKDKKGSEREALLSAFQSASTFTDEPVMIGDLADQMGVTSETLKKRISKTSTLVLGKDNVVRWKKDHDAWVVRNAWEASKDLTGKVKLSDMAKWMNKSEKTIRRNVELAGYEIINGDVRLKEEE